MEPFKDENDLIAELRALRPRPSQEFAAGLDERAAAGFPRRSGRTDSPLRAFVARLRALPPRRLAFSAGATALATLALATALVTVNGAEDSGSPTMRLDSIGAHESGGHLLSHLNPSRGSTGVEYEAAPSVSAGAVGGSSRGTDTGPFASKARHREVERSAELVLGADPDRVADDASQVFDAVHAADGIVLSSAVTGGGAGYAGARFDLLIPAAKLGDALAAFSAIDTVASRHEATDDITAPTVRIGEQLRDSQATIDGLLVQLAGADSDGARAEVEAELQAERRHAASVRSRAAKLDRRANLSRVSLRIETGGGSAARDSSGAWGVGDALHDAGHILAVAAAVTIVGLAIIGPLALIAFFAWLANRARLRRARERTLA